MSSHISNIRPKFDQVLVDIADYALDHKIGSAAAYDTARLCLMDTLGCGLEALSYTRVLERGFALVSDPAGHSLTSASAISPGARLRIRLADGEVKATADGGKPGTRQGTLQL